MSQTFAIGLATTEYWLARPLRSLLTLWRTADPSQPRLDAIKGFRRARDRALEDYLELKQTRADAEAQLVGHLSSAGPLKTAQLGAVTVTPSRCVFVAANDCKWLYFSRMVKSSGYSSASSAPQTKGASCKQ